jgi:hypothetical protein
VIAGHGCPVDHDDAALVVSELFGNACLYGPPGGRVLIGYCAWRDGARIAVCDGGGVSVPRMTPGAGLAEGGRGLRVVDSLAARWGTFRLPAARIVWSDFGRPLRAATADAWAWLPPVLAANPLAPGSVSPAAAPLPVPVTEPAPGALVAAVTS